MKHEKYLSSIYSDGTVEYVSNPTPERMETVKIRLKVAKAMPVDHIWIRVVRNGTHQLIGMEKETADAGVKTADSESPEYYHADVVVTENALRYQFLILTEGILYYYSQRGVRKNQWDQIYDFVLLTDYQPPSWVKQAVFYQILPDRFYNGDPSLDVADGEYTMNGNASYHVRDWNTPAAPFEQAYCMDFYGGDLVGIRKKIPYLKELGITAIYLNPIFYAPSVHKYDCIDYEVIDPHLGGEEELENLSKALHENGMHLVLDISINHTGVAHKWFNRDNLFFDASVGAYQNPDSIEREYYHFEKEGKYDCWAGVDTLPVLNYCSQKLRDKLYQSEDSVLKKWLREPYQIDGWRFDVADEMCKNNAIQMDMEVWPQIRESIRAENPDAYILAESWTDNAKYLQGDCWDASMNYYGFARLLRRFLGLPDPYYWNEPDLCDMSLPIDAESFRDGVMDYLARIPFVFWQQQYNLLNSHDMGRLAHYSIHLGDYRGAVIMLFTMVGIPSVYYGDEAGIKGWTGGFEGARYPMPWDEEERDETMFLLYQKLAKLRRLEAAFSEGGFRFLYTKGKVIAFARTHFDRSWVTVVSISDHKEQVRLPVWMIREQNSKDVFGTDLIWTDCSETEITLKANPHTTYLFCV